MAENDTPQIIKEKAAAFMDGPAFCSLSTINLNGIPETRMMLNLRSDLNFIHKFKYFPLDNFSTYFCTHASSEKMGHLRKNPNASAYYNSGYDGLLLIGKAEIITDKEVKKHFWESNFQWDMYYEEGVDDPEYTIIKLTSERAKFYYELKEYKFSV